MQKKMADYLTPELTRWFDMFAEGIVVIDQDIRVLFANVSYINRWKYTKEELLGMYLPSIRPWTVAFKVLETKKAMYGVMHAVKGFESYIDAVPFIEDGVVIGILIVTRNNTLIDEFYEKINMYKNQIDQMSQRMRDMFRAEYSFDGITGNSYEYIQLAKKAAEVDSSVLITGESGTGKEVVAQSIHNASTRNKFAFVDINCASVPEHLLESELFGYAPGAFSGANKTGKMGLFEAANGGTVFLDEITEMPMALQSKLLRALQERKIRRLGDNKNIPLNIRFIAATNQDVCKLVSSEKFRKDLYYRLAVFVVNIPPLRERKSDLAPLIKQFIGDYYKAARNPKPVLPEVGSAAMRAIEEYSWPGNIRQLKNAIEYACVVQKGNLIERSDLPAYVLPQSDGMVIGDDVSFEGDQGELSAILEATERRVLKKRISIYGSDLAGRRETAKSMGISVPTLYNKLRKHGLINDNHK